MSSIAQVKAFFGTFNNIVGASPVGVVAIGKRVVATYSEPVGFGTGDFFYRKGDEGTVVHYGHSGDAYVQFDKDGEVWCVEQKHMKALES